MKRACELFALILVLAGNTFPTDTKPITDRLRHEYSGKEVQIFRATNADELLLRSDGTIVDRGAPQCSSYARVAVKSFSISGNQLNISVTRIEPPRTHLLIRADLPNQWTEPDVDLIVHRVLTPFRPNIPPVKTGPDLHAPTEPGMTRPVAIHVPDATFTDAARRAKAGASLWVEFTVTEDGSVEDVEAITTDPYGLSESAVATVRTWRFKPATLNGAPVKVRLRSEHNFCLY
jgi:TonB family protein